MLLTLPEFIAEVSFGCVMVFLRYHTQECVGRTWKGK